MKMQSIDDLLFTGMTYTLDFEQQVSKEAEKMAQAASDPEVKEMFQKSVTQGQKYAERIQSAFSKIGAKSDTNDNRIAKAMIDEVENMISNTEASAVRDAALIVAFNQQQAYRVSITWGHSLSGLRYCFSEMWKAGLLAGFSMFTVLPRFGDAKGE